MYEIFILEKFIIYILLFIFKTANIHTTDYITHNIYIGFTFQKHLKGQKEM